MEPLELPALGRPFTLGTLYNAKKNQIIPAITLCDHEDADVKVCRTITNKTDMTSKDSLESKMESLGIRGSLKISALLNKVELKGSGSYLSDTKGSKRQARVVLESSGTTRYESLSMNCFSKEKIENHMEMIKVFGVTHVVVGITYGHQLFLQLETTCASEEEKQKVEGAIKLKLAYIAVQAKGEIKGTYTEEYKKELNELQVKIHGTVELENNPISLEEAVDIFKRIPNLVKDKDCPMTVCLLPLAAIQASVPNVCSQIKEDIVSGLTLVFEDISSSEVALSGIQCSHIAAMEPRIRRNAKQVSSMLNSYKIRMQMNLADILGGPKMEIRASESEQILEVLRKHAESPYSANSLGQYVSLMGKEVQFMEDLVRMLSGSHEDGSRGDGTNSTQSEHGEAGRKKFTIDIRSDEIYVAIPFVNSRVAVLELPIISENNNLHEAMKSYENNNDEGWAHFMAEPLTLPFEDEGMQNDIRRFANTFVDLAAGKHPQKVVLSAPLNIDDDYRAVNKFACVFKGYKHKNSKPSLIMYDSRHEVIDWNFLVPFG